MYPIFTKKKTKPCFSIPMENQGSGKWEEDSPRSSTWGQGDSTNYASILKHVMPKIRYFHEKFVKLSERWGLRF